MKIIRLSKIMACILFCFLFISLAQAQGAQQPALAKQKTNIDPQKYYLIQARHSGKILGIKKESKKKGAKCVQLKNAVKKNRLFTFEPQKKGFYNIIAMHSGRMLAISDASVENGANCVQLEKKGSKESNQLFKLVPAEEGYYYIMAKHSKKVLSVRDFSNEIGAELIQAKKKPRDYNYMFRLLEVQEQDLPKKKKKKK